MTKKKTAVIIVSLLLCFFITGCGSNLISYIDDEGLSTTTDIYRPAESFNDIEFEDSDRSITEYPSKVIYFDTFEENDTATGVVKEAFEYHSLNAHSSLIALVNTTGDENYDFAYASVKQGFSREDGGVDFKQINLYIHMPSGNFSYIICNEHGVSDGSTGYGNVQSYMDAGDIIAKQYNGYRILRDELYINEAAAFPKYLSYILNTLQNYLTPLGFSVEDLGFDSYTANANDILVPATIYHRENYNANIIGEEQRAKQSPPAIGMTKEQVEIGTWGNPDKKNIDEYEWGTHEQWVYEDKGYIYFENGIVDAIQYR